MAKPLIPKRMLFRFSIPIRRCATLWTKTGAKLDKSHILPPLASLENAKTVPEIRMGYSEEGLVFSLYMKDKEQTPWCRPGAVEESDGLQVLIDTRGVHDIHRATRYCHRFAFLPMSGPKDREPTAAWLPVGRARDNPEPIPQGSVMVHSKIGKTGYRLDACLTSAALTGFDPTQYDRIGFNYAVIDREHGLTTLGPSGPLPFLEDPSLWASLELG